MAAGLDADQQRILAAVPRCRDLRHGKIEEVDMFDFHRALSRFDALPNPAGHDTGEIQAGKEILRQ
jgi:hypothetical protein